jgi:Flp pilus assembly protein TadD
MFAAGALCIALAACTQGGPSPLEELSSVSDRPKSEAVGSVPGDPKGDLAKATQYWGKEFGKNPQDAKAALSYAKNLKAMGEKRQALAVLQQASTFHGGNREINSEYGRLALEFDQVSLAQKLLEQADDPANPDWRVISARGTALAKQGSYRSAIPLYERALALSPEQPSVLSNLALAHAMDGQPDRAEPLLKRAARAGGDDPRVSQNLALVLGLQGKYDDAKVAAGRHMASEDANADVEYLRRIVMLDPQPATVDAPAPPQPKVAASKKAPGLKGTATDDGSGGWGARVAATPARP